MCSGGCAPAGFISAACVCSGPQTISYLAFLLVALNSDTCHRVNPSLLDRWRERGKGHDLPEELHFHSLTFFCRYADGPLVICMARRQAGEERVFNAIPVCEERDSLLGGGRGFGKLSHFQAGKLLSLTVHIFIKLPSTNQMVALQNVPF